MGWRSPAQVRLAPLRAKGDEQESSKGEYRPVPVLHLQEVAGGANGDNSDNHWTDNVRGTADDRYLSVAKLETVQPMFIALQATMAQEFSAADASYAKICRALPRRREKSLLTAHAYASLVARGVD